MAIATDQKLLNLGHLEMAMVNLKTYTDTSIASGVSSGIKSVATSGNQVNFYTTANATGNPAFSVDFPTEMFLDQASTTFETNFAWTAAAYPGSSNPNLEGKKVLVLGVKTRTFTNGVASDTIAYSFINLADLIDTYTVATDTTSQRALGINDNAISIKLSSSANNALTTDSTGLLVDITGKVDTVGSATGIVPKFTATGQIESSGIAATSLITIVSGQENKIAAFDATGKLKTTGLDYGTDILTTVANATDYVASFNSSGKVESSGIAKSSIITVVNGASGEVPKFTATGQIESSGIAASNIVTVVGSATDKVAAFTNTGQLQNTSITYGDVITVSDIAADADVTTAINTIFA